MESNKPDALLSIFDAAPVDRRYLTRYAILAAGISLEYFDFIIVSFLLTVIGPHWHLTYGQSTAILLAAGVGSIVGALVCGSLGDRWGRKAVLVACSFLCAASSGATAAVPDGAIGIFAALRFVVGFAVGGTVVSYNALLVETAPSRHRRVLASLGTIFPTIGALLAGLASAAWLDEIGWRGLALLGVAPALTGILAIFLLPESVHWLVARGRFAEAREQVGKLRGVAAESLPLSDVTRHGRVERGIRDLLARPGPFWTVIISWLGVSSAAAVLLLWTPTLFALMLVLPVEEAAQYMVFVLLFGIVGKAMFAVMAQRYGRRTTGMVGGFAAAVALLLAALGQLSSLDLSLSFAGLPVFVLLVIAAFLFVDGSFANIAPYSVEAYGAQFGARASGLGQAANGVGKILGPACVALIAGTANEVSPATAAAALAPVFLFLSGCLLAVGLVFLVLAPRSHEMLPTGPGEGTAAPSAS